MFKAIFRSILLISTFSIPLQTYGNYSNHDSKITSSSNYSFSGIFGWFSSSDQITELKNEVEELREQMKRMEDQQKEIILSLNSAKTELQSTKEDQQRKISDLNELHRILVHYGNNSEGMSALHYAIKIGDVNAVNILIANGADVNSTEMAFRPRAF